MQLMSLTSIKADSLTPASDTIFMAPVKARAYSSFYESDDSPGTSYIPKAPNAAGLVQHIDCPVSYYTGTPDISIPLYDIDVHGYKIPITLNYHASGIRVAQESTWVGLGWELSPGGMVSRTVKCSDDFHEYADSYFGNIGQGYLNAPEALNPSAEYFIDTGPGGGNTLVKDSEPDIFFYSIPGSRGKFLIDKSRGPVLLNCEGASNVKIELTGQIVSGFGSYTFAIIDVLGNRYEFDRKEVTYSYSRAGDLNRNLRSATVFDENRDDVEFRYEAPFKYTSSWLLSKITTALGKEIDFSYSEEWTQLPTQESVRRYHGVSAVQEGGHSPRPSAPQYSCSKTVVKGYRLTSIAWDSGTIDFASSAREDLKGWEGYAPPLKLDRMTVCDKAGRVVRQYRLSYNYLNSERTGQYAHVFKRLMLEKVTDCLDTCVCYSMDYYTDHGMPAKNSNNTDYWGYANGIEQGAEYYPLVYSINTDKWYNGADKTSHISFMRQGTLQSLTSPTGECSRFIFEGRTMSADTVFVSAKVSGSLGAFYAYETDTYEDCPRERATTIKFEDDTIIDISGYAETTTGMPDDYWLYDNETWPVFRVYRLKSDGTKYEDYFYSLTVPAELRTTNIVDYGNYSLGLPAGTYSFEVYSPVKDGFFVIYYNYLGRVAKPGSAVEMGGMRIKEIQGTETRHFTYQGDITLITPVNCYFTEEMGFSDDNDYYDFCYLVQSSETTIPTSTLKSGYIFGSGNVTETKDGYTYHCRTFYNAEEEHPYVNLFLPAEENYYNGLLTEEKIGSPNKVLRHDIYEYSSHDTTNVYGFIYNDYQANYHPYTYSIEYPLLDRKVSMIYGDNGCRTDTTTYAYNHDHQVSEATLLDNGVAYTRQYIYPGQLSGSVYSVMCDRHMVGIPVETRLLLDRQIIKASRTVYMNQDGRILPLTVSSTESEGLIPADQLYSKFHVETTFTNYSEFGNPREIIVPGERTVVLWGYGGCRPVAEIKNATYVEVSHLLGTSLIQRVEESVQPSASDVEAINGLRNLLPSANIVTMEWQPLGNVTSITDGRGFRTDYEYDSSGRLVEESFTDDGSKYVLKTHKYHYHAGQ